MMKKVLILNGPNLNLLGKREPQHYGIMTLEEITKQLDELACTFGIELRHFQSNHEGVLIDQLQNAADWAEGVILNPGGYSHTSVALRDAVSALQIPVIEVHLSNIYNREQFRQQSLIAPVCTGSIAGFGFRSYSAALYILAGILNDK